MRGTLYLYLLGGYYLEKFPSSIANIINSFISYSTHTHGYVCVCVCVYCFALSKLHVLIWIKETALGNQTYEQDWVLTRRKLKQFNMWLSNNNRICKHVRIWQSFPTFSRKMYCYVLTSSSNICFLIVCVRMCLHNCPIFAGMESSLLDKIKPFLQLRLWN